MVKFESEYTTIEYGPERTAELTIALNEIIPEDDVIALDRATDPTGPSINTCKTSPGVVAL